MKDPFNWICACSVLEREDIMLLSHLLARVSVLDLLAWSTALIVSYIVAIVVYRLYFHPLAKYPGPFWACISGFPSYWHTLQQDRHIWLWRLQEEYGKLDADLRHSSAN